MASFSIFYYHLVDVATAYLQSRTCCHIIKMGFVNCWSQYSHNKIAHCTDFLLSADGNVLLDNGTFCLPVIEFIFIAR